MLDFASRLRALRIERHLTQAEVGEMVNMSQRSVAAWESGDRAPSYPVLCELADKFGVSTDDLLGRSASPNRFRALREAKGLTQYDLGVTIGVTQQSVYAWERGEAMPRLQTAIALAELYDVSLDYLLGLSDAPRPADIGAQPSGGSALRRRVISLASTLPDVALVRIYDYMSGLIAGMNLPTPPDDSPNQP